MYVASAGRYLKEAMQYAKETLNELMFHLGGERQ